MIVKVLNVSIKTVPINTSMTTKHLEKAIINFNQTSAVMSLRTSAIEPFHECDALVITNSNYAIEYELKISRSDFFADFKKRKHKSMSNGRGGKISRFYYVVPTNMITVAEVPSYAGLIYVDDNLDCIVVKPAHKLTSHKLTNADITRVYRSIMFRWLRQQCK